MRQVFCKVASRFPHALPKLRQSPQDNKELWFIKDILQNYKVYVRGA